MWQIMYEIVQDINQKCERYNWGKFYCYLKESLINVIFMIHVRIINCKYLVTSNFREIFAYYLIAILGTYSIYQRDNIYHIMSW